MVTQSSAIPRIDVAHFSLNVLFETSYVKRLFDLLLNLNQIPSTLSLDKVEGIWLGRFKSELRNCIVKATNVMKISGTPKQEKSDSGGIGIVN